MEHGGRNAELSLRAARLGLGRFGVGVLGGIASSLV